MRNSRVTGITIAILAVAALAPIVPAAAQERGAPTADRAVPPSRTADQGRVVLRRDGDRAVPFDPVADAPVLRRDGSIADPFLAQVGPPAASPAADGFDWGDALMGAAAGYALILFAWGMDLLIRRRRPRRLAQRPV